MSIRSLIGEVVGDRYRLIEKIGSGGFATVYRAEDSKGHCWVAIKVLHEHLADDLAFIQRFHAELKKALKIRHPGFRKYLGQGEDRGLHYLVMEYLDGQTLAEVLEVKRKLTCSESLEIARQVGEALVAAHEGGIVHRDLKPSNLMMLRDGQVKILDLGIAKDLLSTLHSVPSISSGAALTPRYASPEQLEGKRDIDGRSDLYSLGVSLYQCLYGSLPFPGESPTAILSLERKEQLQFPPTEGQPWVQALLRKLLFYERNQRYQSAAELLCDLAQGGKSALGSAFPTAKPGEAIATTLDRTAQGRTIPKPPVIPKKERHANRKPFLTALGIAAFIVTIGLVGYLVIRSMSTASNLSTVPTDESIPIASGEIPALVPVQLENGWHIFVLPTQSSGQGYEERITKDQYGREFLEAGYFHEGLAPVSINGYLLFIDSFGNVKTPTLSAFPFPNGDSDITRNYPFVSDGMILVRSSEVSYRYFSTQTGTWLKKPASDEVATFAFAYPFSEGLAAVKAPTEKDFYFITTEGQPAFNGNRFTNPSERGFQEQLCSVMDENNQFYFIGLDGERNKQLPYLSNKPADFSCGWSIITLDTPEDPSHPMKFQYQNKNGHLLALIYEEQEIRNFISAESFSENLAWVKIGDEKTFRCIRIDGTGTNTATLAFLRTYPKAALFSEGYAAVWDGKAWSFVDQNGEELVIKGPENLESKLILDPDLLVISSFHSGIAYFQDITTNQYIYITKNGAMFTL